MTHLLWVLRAAVVQRRAPPAHAGAIPGAAAKGRGPIAVAVPGRKARVRGDPPPLQHAVLAFDAGRQPVRAAHLLPGHELRRVVRRAIDRAGVAVFGDFFGASWLHCDGATGTARTGESVGAKRGEVATPRVHTPAAHDTHCAKGRAIERGERGERGDAMAT